MDIKKLLLGRIDLFPFELENLRYFLLTYFPGDIERISYQPRPIQITSYHLVLSRRNPSNELNILLFNQGLATLKSQEKVELYQEESLEGKYHNTGSVQKTRTGR